MTTQANYKSHQRGPWIWFKRIFIGLLILGLFLTAVTLLSGNATKSKLANGNPPPGQLVDIGGYRLHINCIGQGSPTVIMEAGNNDFSVQWSLVQPEIARSTRVCVYDRAGFGWSDASPYPRTLETMVKELHTLLVNANIKEPYVMVGHSFGGIIARAFTRQYPDQIAGIVLVDSAHQEQIDRVPALKNVATQVLGQFRAFSMMQSIGLFALSPEQIPGRGLQGEALQQYRAILATTDYFTAAASETETIFADWGNFQPDNEGILKDIPLIVLSRGLPEPLPGVSGVENQQYEETWREMQKELVALSSAGRQIIAEKSGHYIQIQQPNLVIEAITQISESAALWLITPPEADPTHGIQMSLDPFVPLTDGYLLIDKMEWSETDYPSYAVNPIVNSIKLTDANGKSVFLKWNMGLESQRMRSMFPPLPLKPLEQISLRH